MNDEIVSDDIGKALLGVGFCVFGIFIDNIGITNMKISLNRQMCWYEENPDAHRQAYWKQKRWLFGFSLFLGGNTLNGVGLSFAPQSLFAAVGALGLVFNAINARVILKESFPRRTQVGTFLVVSGSLLAVFFGSHHSQDYDLESIGRKAVTKKFMIYATILVVLITSTYFTIRKLQQMQVEVSTGRRASFSESTVNRLTEKLSLPEVRRRETAHKRRHIALSFLYPWMAGVVGSFTIILAKSSAELVSSSVSGDNQFKKWPFWFVLLGMLAFGGTQIHWLNRGLARYNQMLVIPTFNVCYSLFSILGGGIFFGEFDGFGATAWSVFPLSMCITFTGIYFITTGRDATTKTASSDARRDGAGADKDIGVLPDGFDEVEFSELHAAAAAAVSSADGGGPSRLLMLPHHHRRRKSVSMSATDEEDTAESEAKAADESESAGPVHIKSLWSAPSSTHSSSSYCSGSPRHLSPAAAAAAAAAAAGMNLRTSSSTQTKRSQQSTSSDRHDSSTHTTSRQQLSPVAFTRRLSSEQRRLTGDMKRQQAAHTAAAAASPSADTTSSSCSSDSNISDSEAIDVVRTDSDSVRAYSAEEDAAPPSVMCVDSVAGTTEEDFVEIPLDRSASESSSVSASQTRSKGTLSGFVARHLSTRYTTLREDSAQHSETGGESNV